MPIYEYICKSCGSGFEVMQKLSDEPAKNCKHCLSDNIEKVMSQSAFVLKGHGWYVTDYARKGVKENACTEKAVDKGKVSPCSSCPSRG